MFPAAPEHCTHSTRSARRFVIVLALLGPPFLLFGAAAQDRAEPEKTKEPTLPTPGANAPPPDAHADGEGTREASTSPRAIASYELRARLDEDRHRLTGSGTVHFLNASEGPVAELYWHVYPNAFRDRRSCYFASPFRSRGTHFPDRPGVLELSRLSSIASGTDLLAQATWVAPPECPQDRTDLWVPLPEPLPSGSTVAIEFTWESDLPSLVDRTGFARDFHFLGQWFPKLAALRSDGTWDHFSFYPQSEFSADFGNYRVELDVPDDCAVAATGGRAVPSRTATSPGRATWVFEAAGVHDFAWGAWPHFKERHENVANTELLLFYPPGHDANAEQTLETLRWALPLYSELYGPYPYPSLTVVHPPEWAGAAGGMEYPALITTGGPWHASYWSRAVAQVTLHELAHQWFYGIIASNERQFPALDEGLATYAEGLAARKRWEQRSAFDLLGLHASLPAVWRLAAGGTAAGLPLTTPAPDFASFAQVGSVAYARMALLIQTLEQSLGSEALERALKRYALAARFEHPTPEDLVTAVGAELGPDAAQALTRGLAGATLDYLVEQVESAPATRDTLPPTTLLLPRTDTPLPVDAPGFRTQVVLRRRGDLVLPVNVTFTFGKDGPRTPAALPWAGDTPQLVVDLWSEQPLASVELDAEGRLLCEDSRLNNTWRRPSDAGEDSALSAREWLTGVIEVLWQVAQP